MGDKRTKLTTAALPLRVNRVHRRAGSFSGAMLVLYGELTDFSVPSGFLTSPTFLPWQSSVALQFPLLVNLK